MPTSREFRRKIHDIATIQSAADEQSRLVPDAHLVNCQAFCENVIKLPGGKPYNTKDRPWLVQILNDNSPKIYITKGRQVGASILMLSMILYRIYKYPASVHAYVTMTQKAMHDMSMDKLRPLMRDSGLKYDTNHDRITSYHFDNSAILKMMSAHGKFEQTRGPTVDFCYLDEAQSVEIDELSVLESTMLESEHKQIIIAGTGDWESTPWDRHWLSTTQYEWLLNADTQQHEWIATNPDAEIPGYHISRRMMPSWTQQEEDRWRRQWTPARFDMEYLGIMTRGAQVPFPHSLIAPCLVERPHYLPSDPHQPNSNNEPLCAYIDWAGGGDSWTVIVLARGKYVLAYERFDDSDVIMLERKIQDVIDTWHPAHVISDLGGSPGVLQRIEAKQTVHKIAYGEHPDQAISYKQTKEKDIYAVDKSTMLQMVQAWFSEKTITIPVQTADIWVKDHIMSETSTMKTTTSGKNVYRFKKRDAGHPDDFLMCLGFMASWLYAQTDPNNPENRTYHAMGPKRHRKKSPSLYGMLGK